ncbi:MAG TPA: DUF3459 domain-containing protein, partial [Acidobacteriaceae bacterium]
ERLCHLVSLGRAKIAAALELTAPFVPMLFQGEEWAASSPFQYFTDHDKELGKLISEGRNKEFAAFGWDPGEIPDPQAPATFERSKLNWDERAQPPHSEMLAWYRQLIALRKSLPQLTDGDLSQVRVHANEQDQTLVMERGRCTVAFSLAAKPVTLAVRAGSQIVLASSPEAALHQDRLTLPPDSIAVLLCGEIPPGIVQ